MMRGGFISAESAAVPPTADDAPAVRRLSEAPPSTPAPCFIYDINISGGASSLVGESSTSGTINDTYTCVWLDRRGVSRAVP